MQANINLGQWGVFYYLTVLPTELFVNVIVGRRFTTLHNLQTRQLSPTTRCAGPDRRRFSTNTTAAAAAAAAAAAMTAAMTAAAVLSHYRYERLRLSFTTLHNLPHRCTTCTTGPLHAADCA